MAINLLAEGLKFMVLGMGVVFVFLTLLVWLMKGQALLIASLTAQATPSPMTSESASIPFTDEDDEASRVAAISAAVQAFRRDHNIS